MILYKGFYILVLILLVFKGSTAQVNKSEDLMCFYIKKLNWNSYSVSTTYGSFPYLLDDAKKIISINNKHKKIRLLQSISDSTKTVVIHIILTKILEPKKQIFSQVPHFSMDTINNFTYTFNGLSWNMNIVGPNVNYHINQDEINKIKQYWNNKIGYKKE